MTDQGIPEAHEQPVQSQFVFSGRVQGVGFRATACQHAESTGLQGWVRNEQDGTVCMVVEGPSGAIDDLLSRIQASFGGGLSGIERQNAPPLNEFSGFRILRG
jgi:acylphosphatase